MDWAPVRAAVIVILGLIALGLAAATLPSSVPLDGTGPGSVDNGSDGGGLPRPEPVNATSSTVEVPYLGVFLQLVGLLLLLVAGVYAFFYWREAVIMVIAGAVIIALLFLLFEHLGSSISPGGGGVGGGNPIFSNESTVDGNRSMLRPVYSVLIGFLLLAVLVAVYGQYRWRRGDPEEESSFDDEAVAMGRAAGRAADRIEASGTVDNEVYRAWLEMTELLDVSNRETTTAGAFATAAVEAGMDRDDVDELTRLFEDVRYGGREPTETDEQRAIAVFRRIEATYAPEEA